MPVYPDRTETDVTLPKRSDVAVIGGGIIGREIAHHGSAPSRWVIRSAWRTAAQTFPRIAELTMLENWVGLIDVTPDAVPVISQVEATPGLLIASGFTGHGFGMGPGAGHLAADLVTGDRPIANPIPFRLERFRHRAHAVNNHTAIQ
ncbi:NAD(P)/FAD-dependent oxidoreductase [Agrobacterium leguminum]|uniref:NAD(P)/FAD-dependent oxidoreductase n=1 Tax=Agrobacterium leguminum TaxID=2792015 RepID=UPI003CE5BB97